MKFLTIVATAAVSIAAIGPSFAEGNPSGDWVVADRTAVVKISKCGGGYCGFVAKGQPGKDYRNPDPRKRDRSVIGMEVMFGMKPTGSDTWSGETYNADDGQFYSAKITLQGSTLQIEGCVHGGGPCGSQTWTRTR